MNFEQETNSSNGGTVTLIGFEGHKSGPRQPSLLDDATTSTLTSKQYFEGLSDEQALERAYYIVRLFMELHEGGAHENVFQHKDGRFAVEDGTGYQNEYSNALAYAFCGNWLVGFCEAKDHLRPKLKELQKQIKREQERGASKYKSSESRLEKIGQDPKEIVRKNPQSKPWKPIVKLPEGEHLTLARIKRNWQSFSPEEQEIRLNFYAHSGGIGVLGGAENKASRQSRGTTVGHLLDMGHPIELILAQHHQYKPNARRVLPKIFSTKHRGGGSNKPSKSDLRKGVSIYPSQVVPLTANTKPEHIFKSAHNSEKIGKYTVDSQGRIIAENYTLAWEERATCPSDCAFYEGCYMNDAPYAKRFKYDEENEAEQFEALKQALVKRLTSCRHPFINIRLHLSGDFATPAYARFWQSMLEKYPRLMVHGYTHRRPDDEIGQEVMKMNAQFPERCLVFWSDAPELTTAQDVANLPTSAHELAMDVGEINSPEDLEPWLETLRLNEGLHLRATCSEQADKAAIAASYAQAEQTVQQRFFLEGLQAQPPVGHMLSANYVGTREIGRLKRHAVCLEQYKAATNCGECGYCFPKPWAPDGSVNPQPNGIIRGRTKKPIGFLNHQAEHLEAYNLRRRLCGLEPVEQMPTFARETEPIPLNS